MHTNKPIFATAPEEAKGEIINKWFEKFVDDIKTDHFLVSEGIAPKDKMKIYDDLIFGNRTDAMSKVREGSTMYFITHIITDYLNELKLSNNLPIKLAFGLSDSKILVWSVINDDDENTEDALLITEAKINGKYHQHGFYINSTIIEKSDNIETPPHYQTIIG